MDKKDIVYDPTDIQIDSYGKSSLIDMDAEELSNPQSVKMLLYQHLLNLHELKATKSDLAKNKLYNDLLKNDREELRIKLAGFNHSIGVDMASIFISFLGGFAINLLTNDWSNGLGWVIFVLCVAILFFFKYPLISSAFTEAKKAKE